MATNGFCSNARPPLPIGGKLSVRRASDYIFGTLFVFSIAILTAIVYQPTTEGPFDNYPIIENQTSKDGQSFNLLHVANFVYAAEQGEYKTVVRYLNMGMAADAQDHNKDTALMGAALNGHVKIVKLLLMHQADPNVKNSGGYNAIDFAKINEDSELTAFLQQSHGGTADSLSRSISSAE